MKKQLLVLALLGFLQTECESQKKSIRLQINLNSNTEESSSQSYGYFDPNTDNELSTNLEKYRESVHNFWEHPPKSISIDIEVNLDPELEKTLPESYGYFDPNTDNEAVTNLEQYNKAIEYALQKLQASISNDNPGLYGYFDPNNDNEAVINVQQYSKPIKDCLQKLQASINNDNPGLHGYFDPNNDNEVVIKVQQYSKPIKDSLQKLQESINNDNPGLYEYFDPNNDNKVSPSLKEFNKSIEEFWKTFPDSCKNNMKYALYLYKGMTLHTCKKQAVKAWDSLEDIGTSIGQQLPEELVCTWDNLEYLIPSVKNNINNAWNIYKEITIKETTDL